MICPHCSGYIELEPDGGWCPKCEEYFPRDILKDTFEEEFGDYD